MNKIQYFFNYIGVTLIICIYSPHLSWAGKYIQPAYITNVYFCNNVLDKNNFKQPDEVINVLRSNRPAEKADFVMNLLLDKAKHQIEIDLLDNKGEKFDRFIFDSITADKDNWAHTVAAHYHGRLPDGGVFFKVYDRLNGSDRTHIGTFRVWTE